MSNIVKPFYSREDRVFEILEPTGFAPTHDEDTVYSMMTELEENVNSFKYSLDDQYAEYDRVISEGSTDFTDVVKFREIVVGRWALLQYMVSAMAVCLGIDGNEAFIRQHESFRTGFEADMKGL